MSTNPQMSREKAGCPCLELDLNSAGSDLALALGVIRTMTLLTLHDPGLDEVERRLVGAVDVIAHARQVTAHVTCRDSLVCLLERVQ
jgi:hypothetical protein